MIRSPLFNRRKFLGTSAAGAGGLVLGGLPSSFLHVEGQERRPNILWIIAEDSEHTRVLERMREQLDEWISETGDRGETPEDPRVAARVYLERHLPNHRQVMERRGLSVDVSPTEYLSWWEKQIMAAGRTQT